MNRQVVQLILLIMLCGWLCAVNPLPVRADDIAIRGMVTDGEGRPLANVALAVLRQASDRQAGLAWEEVAKTTTDSDGQYVFAGLAPATYRVVLRPSASLADIANLILIPEGEVAASALQEDVNYFSGQVTDDQHAGIRRIAVSLERLTNSEWGNYWTLLRRTLTDGNGQWKLRNVPPGTYRVSFSDTLYPERYSGEFYNDTPLFDEATDLVLAPGGAYADLNAQLAPTGRITGTVEDLGHQPVAGAIVTFYRQVGSAEFPDWQAANSAVTLADGSYDGRGLDGGLYRVGFEDGEVPPHFIPEFHANVLNLEAATDIAVAPGQTVQQIDAQLAPWSMVTGQVANRQGEPLNEIVVTLWHYVPEWGIWQSITSVSTDAGGGYTFGMLTPGTYRLQFADSSWPARYLSQFYQNATTVETATDLVVGEGATVAGIDMVLAAPSAIRGRVSDESGSPLADINVTAFQRTDDPVNGPWFTTISSANTDGSGTYELPGLTAGNFQIEFKDPRWPQEYHTEYFDNKPSLTEADDLAVRVEETVTGIDAQLVHTGRISGRVTDQQGAPIASLQVTALVYDEASQFWYSFVSAGTDALGNYVVAGLDPGTYRIQFSDVSTSPRYLSEYYDNAPSIESATDIVLIANEEVPGIDAVLSQGSHIHGRVTDEGGNPLSSIRVSAVGTDHFAMTDDNGEYDLSGLALGSYRVEFADWSWPPLYANEYYRDVATLAEATAIVVDEESTVDGIDAQLASGAHITGQVTDQTNNPLPSLTVQAYRHSVDSAGNSAWTLYGSTITEGDGLYDLGGLAAGVYRIEFATFYVYPYLQTEYYNDVLSVDQGAEITLAAGETVSGIDAQLAEATSSITGTVTDEQGNPLADIWVAALRFVSNGSGGGDWVDEASEVTDTSGHYTFANLQVGRYRVQFSDWTGQYQAEYYDNALAIEGATDIEVGVESAIGNINAQLAPNAGVNMAPVALNDRIAVIANQTGAAAAASVLSNDGDPNGDTLTSELVDGPHLGTLNLHPDGTFTYTPYNNRTSVDTFTYRVNDGVNPSNLAVVTVVVDASAPTQVYRIFAPLIRR